MTEELHPQAEVTVDRLSRLDWLRLVWGFWWRGLCFLVGSALVGFVIGFVVGFVAAILASAMGIPRGTYGLPVRAFTGAVGFVVGLWLFTFYIRWLLRSRFGSLRLALVRVNA